jgi:hypothetical protein
MSPSLSLDVSDIAIMPWFRPNVAELPYEALFYRVCLPFIKVYHKPEVLFLNLALMSYVRHALKHFEPLGID